MGFFIRESVFNTEVIHSLRAQGAWAHKLTDTPASLARAMRFVPEKPCDIIAFIGGRGVGIEGKQQKKYEAFGIRHLRDAQVRELDAMVEEGKGEAFIFLNIRIASPRTNRLVIFNWKLWREKLKSGVSLKKKEIESLPFLTGKSGIFDLSDFCRSVVERVDAYGPENHY